MALFTSRLSQLFTGLLFAGTGTPGGAEALWGKDGQPGSQPPARWKWDRNAFANASAFRGGVTGQVQLHLQPGQGQHAQAQGWQGCRPDRPGR